jgi:pimeloyl-ACP methyl ester carboxylesterase
MAMFVLIHGSWHGAWCWYKIVPRLETAGHKAIAPDLPAHGRDWRKHKSVTLDTYVDGVCEILDAQTEPVVLVAHSRGGMVISQAAEERPDKISQLVYLAAFLIPDDQRVLEYGEQDTESLIRANLDINLQEGCDMLRRKAYRDALYADCSDEDISLCDKLLTPELVQPTMTPLRLTEQRFGRLPRYYIELSQDRAVSAALQRRMYTQMPCEKVMAIDASHSAYFSRPDELTRHLLSLI